MAENEKDITIEDLPEPISRQDKLLHNIIDDTPDISDLEPLSRQEVYLKYIAMNGSGGGGGGGSSVNVVQTTGQSTTDVMSQKAVTDEIGKLGTAAYCDTGGSDGNVPILDANGKLSNSVIPSLAITDTFVAANEEEMLNIQGAEKGDICVRTDENKTYILDETPARYRRSTTRTTLSDWIELQTPTDEVSSVNGQKGNVVLSAGDVGAYTKEEVDGKLPTIVQARGTSTTDVMSQKAVSDNTCFGVDSTKGDGYSSCLGRSADCSGRYGLALGYMAKSTGINTVSIGAKSTATSDNCVSLGNNAKAQSYYGTALGGSTNTSDSYAVALGSYSKATERSVVSVGDGSTNADYGTRRIVNVKDPVNNQDAATKKYVDTKTASSKVTVVQTTGTSTTSVMSQNAVSQNTCFGRDAEDNGNLNITLGNIASSTGDNNITIGALASTNNADHVESNADDCISIGTSASVTKLGGMSIGGNSNCSGEKSVAIGYGSKATEDWVVSVSDPNFSIKRRIVNVSDPVNDQDAATKKYVDDKVSGSGGGSSVTVVQEPGTSTTDVMSQKAVSDNTCFGYGAEIKSSYCSSFGKGATATGENSSSFGGNAKALSSASVSVGYMAQSSSNYTTALGSNSAVGVNSGYAVALGCYSKAIEPSVVSVGSGDTNTDWGTRRIVNVKDPVNAQDAATKTYADSKVVTYTATILANAWGVKDAAGFYRQEIALSGILPTDNPLVGVITDNISSSETVQSAQIQLNEFSKICQITTDYNTLFAKCFNTPTVDLDIRLVCFR